MNRKKVFPSAFFGQNKADDEEDEDVMEVESDEDVMEYDDSFASSMVGPSSKNWYNDMDKALKVKDDQFSYITNPPLPPPIWNAWGLDDPENETVDRDWDPVALRAGPSKPHDCEHDDFLFQVNDATISFESAQDNDDCDEDSQDLRDSTVLMHGNDKAGERVCVEFEGYLPYFWVSLAENAKSILWVEENIMEPIHNGKRSLPRHDLIYYGIQGKLPTVGFTDTETKPFCLFQFRTMRAYFAYRKAIGDLYPAPTREEVESETYSNDVMLCEAYAKEEMKFYDWLDITSCGWVKLKAGTYKSLPADRSRAPYAFSTKTVEEVKDDSIAPSIVDSFDVEAVRHAEDEEMPDPDNPDDVTASIAHVIQPTDQSSEPYYIVFTWGMIIPAIPTHDRKGRPLPQLPIVIKNYSSEKKMWINWAHWWLGRCDSDVIIGWNIFGFDLYWVMRKLMTIPGIPDSCRVWGRIFKWVTNIVESKIESKAISYNVYKRTPAPGRVYLDLLVLYQRDVTLRLHDYKLDTVTNHYLKEGKEDVHFTEIKHLFYGIGLPQGTLKQDRIFENVLSPSEQKGLLLYYNIWDSWLVLRLFFHSAIWPKTINVSRVNRVLPELLCPRGQQIRVYGGYHYVASKNNYVIYRPHYHPILDDPIFEDMDMNYSASKDVNGTNHNKDGDADAWVDYMSNMFGKMGLNKLSFTSVTVDNDGKIKTAPVEVGPSSSHHKRILEDDGETTGNKNVKIDVLTKIALDHKRPTAPEKAKTSPGRGFDFSKFKTKDGKNLVSILKGDPKARQQRTYIGGPNGKPQVIPPSKSKSKEAKNFVGGKVKDPKRGIYDNMIILDFNSLYPNLMITYKLDPALLVLDKRYALRPGVSYYDVKFSERSIFRFAQSKDGVPFKGVMIQHTGNLLTSRKIAQGEMAKYDAMIEMERVWLLKTLKDRKKYSEMLSHWNRISAVKTNNINNFAPVIKLMMSLVYCLKPEIKIEDWQKRLQAEVDERIKEKKPAIPVIVHQIFQQIYLDARDSRDVVTDLFEGIGNLISDLGFLCIFKDILLDVIIGKQSKEEKDKSELELMVENANAAIQNPETGNAFIELLGHVLSLIKKHKADSTNYNARQNELKVGANSTFGFLGAGKIEYDKTTGRLRRSGMMTCAPVSACVTFLGRRAIELSEKFVETEYPGSVVCYEDTDSLFVDVTGCGITEDEEGFKATFPLGKEMAERITKQFPGTMRIVHEKTARRIILYNAKCYVLDKFLSPTDAGKLEVKGLFFNKRDCCMFANHLGNDILEVMVRQRDTEGSKKLVSEKLSDLVQNPSKYLDDLAIFQKIGKKKYGSGDEEDDFTGVPGHVRLNTKVRERTPVRAKRTGETIKYLYVSGMYERGQSGKWDKWVEVNDLDHKKKKWQKIEEFGWAVEKKLPIDVHWYLENQIKHTVQTIFAPIFPEWEDLMRGAVEIQKRKQMNIKGTIEDRLRPIKSSHLNAAMFKRFNRS